MALFSGKKRKYDISFADGIGARLITWMTALMVFFLTLMGAVNLALGTAADNWVAGLSGSLTVEIRQPLTGGADDRADAAQQQKFSQDIQKVLNLSGKHPAITSAHVLSRQEITALVEPWLGEKAVAQMPLPALIDIKLAPKADTTALQRDILKLVPQATVDSHQDTLDDVKRLIATVRGFILLLTGIIVALAVVAISGIVRSKFAIHLGETEILHQLGASDEYIARQFRQHALRNTFVGALAGIGCMAVTLLIVGAATQRIDPALIPHLQLTPLHWIILFAAPVAGGIVVAHVTAQSTVMRALSKMT